MTERLKVQHQPKPDVCVPVARIVPVAVGGAAIVWVIIPATAAQTREARISRRVAAAYPWHKSPACALNLRRVWII